MTTSTVTVVKQSWPEPNGMLDSQLVQEYGALKARGAVKQESWSHNRLSKIVDELRSRGLLP